MGKQDCLITIVSAAFQTALERQLQQCLNSFRVLEVATEMAEPQAIALEGDPRWIDGMNWRALPLMLYADAADSFNGHIQWRAVGEGR